MKRKRKVLLVGAEGYSRKSKDIHLKCVKWETIEQLSNIRDYDVVIINLLELDPDKRAKVSWDKFPDILSFNHARDILQNRGGFIILGDPRFRIKIKSEDQEKDVPFLYWTGIRFAWDADSGDTITFIDDYDHRSYEEYVKHFEKWSYSLRRCELDSDTVEKYFDTARLQQEKIVPKLFKHSICWNRYKNDLLFSVRFQLVKYGEPINSFGPIIFLPEISKSPDETILIVLRDLCGVESELPEPEWIQEYTPPGQKKIDVEIEKLRDAIKLQFEELKKLNQKRSLIRQCLKLLYEREFALEPVVRNILRRLGAHVQDPTEKNKEDGWVTISIDDAVLEGVLEIKSTKSEQFGEDGRKQLLDWIDRGRTTREKQYKGIFIGNSSVEKPLKERTWAFSDSWKKSAKLSGICAIKTEDLYVIYLLHAQKKLDTKKFWKDLFSTKGVFDMTSYLEQFGEKEDG